MLGKKMGDMDSISLGTYDGIKLVYLEGSTDGTADCTVEGLLLGASL